MSSSSSTSTSNETNKDTDQIDQNQEIFCIPFGNSSTYRLIKQSINDIKNKEMVESLKNGTHPTVKSINEAIEIHEIHGVKNSLICSKVINDLPDWAILWIELSLKKQGFRTERHNIYDIDNFPNTIKLALVVIDDN